mgnify:CR=1 FL=1
MNQMMKELPDKKRKINNLKIKIKNKTHEN